MSTVFSFVLGGGCDEEGIAHHFVLILTLLVTKLLLFRTWVRLLAFSFFLFPSCIAICCMEGDGEEERGAGDGCGTVKGFVGWAVGCDNSFEAYTGWSGTGGVIGRFNEAQLRGSGKLMNDRLFLRKILVFMGI